MNLTQPDPELRAAVRTNTGSGNLISRRRAAQGFSEGECWALLRGVPIFSDSNYLPTSDCRDRRGLRHGRHRGRYVHHHHHRARRRNHHVLRRCARSEDGLR